MTIKSGLPDERIFPKVARGTGRVLHAYAQGGTHRERVGPWVCGATGAKISQLTSAAFIHTNIYCWAPVFTPDSRCFIYERFQSLDSPNDFWLCDLQTHNLRRLTYEGSVSSPVMGPDGKWVVYMHPMEPKTLAIKRISLETFETETLTVIVGYQFYYPLATLSPDGRWYVTPVRMEDGDYGLLRVDLVERRHGIIHRGSEIFNANMIFEPGSGRDILVQHNRGGIWEYGKTVRSVGEQGATIYLIDDEGENLRRLAIGQPYSPGIGGHQSWIGDTRRILTTIGQSPEIGNLVSIGEGDAGPSTVASGASFCHPCSSSDGRWFVSDVMAWGEYRNGAIVVGSIQTGKFKLLWDSEASLLGPQYVHPHPFFSPDSRHVVLNSDRTGIPQIYAVEIPDGFLEELES